MTGVTHLVNKYTPQGLTASLPLKNHGWKTILSFLLGDFDFAIFRGELAVFKLPGFVCFFGEIPA